MLCCVPGIMLLAVKSTITFETSVVKGGAALVADGAIFVEVKWLDPKHKLFEYRKTARDANYFGCLKQSPCTNQFIDSNLFIMKAAGRQLNWFNNLSKCIQWLIGYIVQLPSKRMEFSAIISWKTHSDKNQCSGVENPTLLKTSGAFVTWMGYGCSGGLGTPADPYKCRFAQKLTSFRWPVR